MKRYIHIVFLLLAALSVQAQDLLNYPLDTVNGEEMYRYPVEKSIGLYRIGVNFNVSQAEIVRCNPQLRERGLHYGDHRDCSASTDSGCCGSQGYRCGEDRDTCTGG